MEFGASPFFFTVMFIIFGENFVFLSLIPVSAENDELLGDHLQHSRIHLVDMHGTILIMGMGTVVLLEVLGDVSSSFMDPGSYERNSIQAIITGLEAQGWSCTDEGKEYC